jgi:hypothetical protein
MGLGADRGRAWHVARLHEYRTHGQCGSAYRFPTKLVLVGRGSQKFLRTSDLPELRGNLAHGRGLIGTILTEKFFSEKFDLIREQSHLHRCKCDNLSL